MLTTGNTTRCSTADRYGITASVLCAIHCAISPLIILIAPTLSLWWSSNTFHVIGAFIVIPLALFTLYRGQTAHKNKWPFIAGFIGSAIILIALLPLIIHLHPLIFTWGIHDASSFDTQLSHLCCPVVTSSAHGGSVSIPWASLLTLIGSLFLIAGHMRNIIEFKCLNSGETEGCFS